MKIETSQVTKIRITDIERLDPVTVYIEDIQPKQGKITIECYGKSWSHFWGGMGSQNVAQFFCSCNDSYLAEKLDSSTKPFVYDADAIKEQASKKGLECWRDDPWNDYELLSQLYGPDPMGWQESMPTMPNHEYEYLIRIIIAVRNGLTQYSA